MTTLTALPPAPVPGAEDFEAVAGVFLDAMPTFATEVNALQADVNAKHADVDEAATAILAESPIANAASAAASAATATAQAGIATTKATDADASANNAATAVVAQLTALKTQTETARDAALAGLGAADNSQLLSNLAGQDSYAVDISGQLAQEIVGLPAGVEALANFAVEVMDLVGAAARQAGGAAQIVPAPANASARGSPGEWAWDSGFIYVCTALNTWKRVAIATW